MDKDEFYKLKQQEISGERCQLKVNDLVRHASYGIGRVSHFCFGYNLVCVRYIKGLVKYPTLQAIESGTIKRVGRIKNLKKK